MASDDKYSGRRRSVPPQSMGDIEGERLMVHHTQEGPTSVPMPQWGASENKDSTPRPVVARLLDDQQAELYKLSELISMLGDMITPAMLPSNPNASGMSEDDTPEMSELARSIENNTDVIKTMQRRVQDYINRVEI